jgi:hypothetical protein
MNCKIARIGLLIALLLLGTMVAMGQTAEKTAKPEITKADRVTINDYYKHLHGTLAPASLDRKGFGPEIERALIPGNKVPAQLEKQLEWLPKELEAKLASAQPGYIFQKLGRHVLLVRRSDLMIADIVREPGGK